ncbi:hypothetical protein [Cardinium endosymbiont of Dermatophagoides farinae]|uniref:hypothetical protein n=1 Tax=Cardinium endosymbiont of Dermatophagoides farinae TaxID=2597823 RepID=UPI001CB8D8BE|nr:hypothetical protein [Cardinium endosymbiont of Dermatophagoides farinae]
MGEVTNETITNKEREETYKGNNENAKRQKDDELATLVRQKAMQDNIKKGEVK